MFHEMLSAIIYVFIHYAPEKVDFNIIVIDLRVFLYNRHRTKLQKNVCQQIVIYKHALRFFYLKYK